MPLAPRRKRRRGRLELPQHRRRRWWDGWQPGIWIVLGLAFVLFYSLITWLWPAWIGPLLLRTVPVQPAPLTAVAGGDGLVLRQEEILRAPLAGRLRPEAAEGEWVLGQQVVARVGEAVVVAPRAGIIRYSWDGQEALWDATELLHEPSRPEGAAMGGSAGSLLVRRESGAWTRGADPVGRLVQPAGASLFVWLPQTAAGWLPPAGATVSVTAVDPAADPAAMAVVAGRIQGWRVPDSGTGQIALQLSLDSLPEGLMDARLVDVKLALPVTGDGRIVPLAALWVRNGRLGVFVCPAQGGLRPLWTPVKLLAVWSARAQVAATREQSANTAWVDRLAAQVWPQGSPQVTSTAEGKAVDKAVDSGAVIAWQRRLDLLARLGHLVTLSSVDPAAAGAEPIAPIPDGPFAAWLGLEDSLVAVDGLPEGVRVVTNPAWAVRWRL
ncbi:MAG: hypothetical protein ACM3VX_07175 [Bacteroidota bacterium]